MHTKCGRSAFKIYFILLVFSIHCLGTRLFPSITQLNIFYFCWPFTNLTFTRKKCQETFSYLELYTAKTKYKRMVEYKRVSISDSVSKLNHLFIMCNGTFLTLVYFSLTHNTYSQQSFNSILLSFTRIHVSTILFSSCPTLKKKKKTLAF